MSKPGVNVGPGGGKKEKKKVSLENLFITN